LWLPTLSPVTYSLGRLDQGGDGFGLVVGFTPAATVWIQGSGHLGVATVTGTCGEEVLSVVGIGGWWGGVERCGDGGAVVWGMWGCGDVCNSSRVYL
jgi:hypothetical protein